MILTGQIMGWIAAVLMFISYQCKDHKKLIVIQTLSTLSVCISYMLLNAWSGMVLNVVCIIRNFVIYKKDKKIFSHSFWRYLLAGVMAVMGIFSWQGIMSLFIVVALVINTLFLYSSNVQNLRKSVIVTSAMIFIYNAYYTVWGGMVNELIAICSSIIGIYRFRKEGKNEK